MEYNSDVRGGALTSILRLLDRAQERLYYLIFNYIDSLEHRFNMARV